MKILPKDDILDSMNDNKDSIFDDLASLFAKSKGGGFKAGVGFHSIKGSVLEKDNDPYANQEPSGNFPVLEYPIGLSDPTSHNSGPMMVITGFKYTRRHEGRLLSSKYDGDSLADPETGSIKIQFVIRLPLPGGLSTSISNSYSDHDGIGNLLNQADISSENANGDMSNAINFAQGLVNDVMSNRQGESGGARLGRNVGLAADVAQGAMSGGVSGGIMAGVNSIGRDIGVAMNKNALVTAQYGGPDVMTHSFNISMIPTNKNESVMIRQIIQILQEFSTGRSMMNTTSLIVEYPSVFNIEFVTNKIIETPGKKPSIGGIPLPKIPFVNDVDTTSRHVKTERVKGVLAIPDCYLTSVNATFNQGQAKLMSDNAPSTYNLALSFKNTMALTRNNLRALHSNANFDDPDVFEYEPLEELEDLNDRSFIEDILSTTRF